MAHTGKIGIGFFIAKNYHDLFTNKVLKQFADEP